MTYKKKRKSWFIKAKNFAIACFKHVIDGLQKTSFDEQLKRLDICTNCVHSENEWFECSLCGCPVDEKVKWKSEKCPEKKW